MNKKTKILITSISAAAAGVAIAWYLQSENGKNLLTKLKDVSEKTGKDLLARWAKTISRDNEDIEDDAYLTEEDE